MRIGIIGPSKLEYVRKINENSEEIIWEIVKIIAKSGNEVVLTPDKDSVSEFFAEKFIENKGKKVYVIVPLEDKEFGFTRLNLDLGEQINCGTWRNQPEKLNEECDVLLCLGYSVGGLIEIAYSKWFKPKKVYIIKELISKELPEDGVRELDIKYISYKEIVKIIE